MAEETDAAEEIHFTSELPAPDALHRLFGTTGWNARLQLTEEQLAAAMRASWFMVCAYEGDALVGTGRMVSDGFYQCFVCDVIIRPDRQGRGIGRAVMERLLAHARSQGIRWLQLTSAAGKRGFYEQLGFVARPDDAPGMEIRF